MGNPEELLYCVFQSQGRSHNLFSDFHISEDALEHDGLIVTVELNEFSSHMYTIKLILLNLISILLLCMYLLSTSEDRIMSNRRNQVCAKPGCSNTADWNSSHF